MLLIRKGEYDDLSQIVKIYDHLLTDEENGGGTTGWIRGIYPTENTALEALRAGDLFVIAHDETVVAAARINQIQVPEYEKALWRYRDISPEQIMVLHTLVVEPSLAGKGYGSAFVKFYEQYALENHCHYLRMDTNIKNMKARKLYKHLGYWETGVISCTFNGIPNVQLVCVEKLLE